MTSSQTGALFRKTRCRALNRCRLQPPGLFSGTSISSGLEILTERESQVPGLADLTAVLAQMETSISFTALPQHVLGRYTLETRFISLNGDLSNESPEAVAMVLAHEAQHALDHNLGRIPGDSLACFDSEVRAFDIQIALWQVIWGAEGKPDPSHVFGARASTACSRSSKKAQLLMSTGWSSYTAISAGQPDHTPRPMEERCLRLRGSAERWLWPFGCPVNPPRFRLRASRAARRPPF